MPSGADEALEEAVAKHDSPKSILWLALAAGIVPCPGVVLVMLFCSAMGRTLPGLLLALCVTLGMAMTSSLEGLIVIIARNAAIRNTRFSLCALQKVELFMRVSGGSLIFSSAFFPECRARGLNHILLPSLPSFKGKATQVHARKSHANQALWLRRESANGKEISKAWGSTITATEAMPESAVFAILPFCF